MPLAVQRALAAMALVLVSPVLAVLAIAVRISSPGPVLHRAIRVSKGDTFVLLKFRTMHEDAAASGIGITAAADPRVTHLGRVLRRSRLDELPQLWNVVRGEMALVGPRPEDPRFVDWDDPLHALVFRALPGITGPTALAFRDEELMLAEAAVARARANGRTEADLKDIEQAYREGILPRKLAMDADYLRDRSIRSDLAVIARTLMAIAGKPHGARRGSDG